MEIDFTLCGGVKPPSVILNAPVYANVYFFMRPKALSDLRKGIY